MKRGQLIYRKIITISLIAFLIILGVRTTFGQGWEKTFGGSGNDRAREVWQTSDGGFIIVGSKDVGIDGSEDMDIYLIKTDEDGDELWSKTFGDEHNERGRSVCPIAGEGYAVLSDGWAYRVGMTLIKTDRDGNEQWSKTFSDKGREGHSVRQTMDGGFIISGTRDDGYKYGFGFLLKTDADGNELWDVEYGANSYASSAQQTSDGGFIHVQGWDMGIIKTDADGKEQWSKVFEGIVASDVQQTVDGGYIITGFSTGVSTGGSYHLIKTDTTGNQLWIKTYSVNFNHWPDLSVQQTKDLGFIFVGEKRSTVDGESDIYLHKTDAEGNQLWSQTFGGSGIERGRSVQQTTDGGYIIVGETESFGAGGSDVFLVYYKPVSSLRIQNPDNGHWYQRIDNSMGWYDAKDYCESMGGYLATINSQKEHEFVYNNLGSVSPHDCWLGGTDEVVEGEWEWITDENFDYTRWMAGAPNNCGDEEHYLMYITPNSWSVGDQASASLWNDLATVVNKGACNCGDCSEIWPMSTICEWGERELEIVNDFVSFEPAPSTYGFTSDTAGCQAGAVGKYNLDATMNNISQKVLSSLYLEVKELTNNNLLLTDNGLIGEGEGFEVPNSGGYDDSILSPDEYVDVPFTVCLENRDPFSFFIDVFGATEDIDIEKGLAASYPFNGNANDESENGHHGMLHGATLTEDRFGDKNSAYSFDGTDDYINIGQQPDFPSLNAYAVSLWFLNDGRGVSSSDSVPKIISKGTTWDEWDDSNFYIGVYYQFSGKLIGNGIADSSKNYWDNLWHHVVLNKKNAIDGELWVDGVLKDISTIAKVVNNIDLMIGYMASEDSSPDFWPGKIDDIRIYNRAISEDEIQALYNPGKKQIRFIDSGQRLGFFYGECVALGDLDGDGDLDAFVGNNDAIPDDVTVDVWFNDGSGYFSDSGQNFEYSVTYSVSLGDLDSDGDLDVLTGGWPYPKVIFNDGSGYFSDSGQSFYGFNSYSVSSLGDLDGDGDLDAFLVSRDLNIDNDYVTAEVWFNDGSGYFSDSGQNFGRPRIERGTVSLGDLDNDGDLDAFYGMNGPNEVWFNDGSGYFSDSGQSLGSSRSGVVSLGDLDGDGDLDAFIGNSYTSTPSHVWFNDGSGHFSDSGQSIDGADSAVALGDLDSDGDLDAFTGAKANNVMVNDGSGHFSDSGQSLDDSRSRGVSLGDLDGDGDLDAFGVGYPDKVWLNITE